MNIRWTGRAQKEESMSFKYEYVTDKEFLFRVRKACNEDMKKIEDVLRRKHSISCQYFLIGSGAKNLITTDINGLIDLDYNFNVSKGMEYDERNLKISFMNSCNEVMRASGLEDVQDSTSAISTRTMYFKDDPKKREFKIDIGIVTFKNDKWYRLIHEKNPFDRYYWNPVKDSNDYRRKADELKKYPELWLETRDEYLRLKNLYLSRNDHNHPSFICYIEAINNIYNKHLNKSLLRW